MVKFRGREEVGGRVLALPRVIVLENDPEFEVLLSTGQEYLWLCRDEVLVETGVSRSSELLPDRPASPLLLKDFRLPFGVVDAYGREFDRVSEPVDCREKLSRGLENPFTESLRSKLFSEWLELL